jgi:serine/threonine-protein kinase
VVAVRGCFEIEQCVSIVMDYVAGPDLGTRAAAGVVTPEEAAAIGRGTALGLQAAHRRGLLHRNVKPGNILIGAEVRARLADFGISGLTGGDQPNHRNDYISPEVLAGQPADGRSDLYGLGLSLFFGLTGELPTRQAEGQPPHALADGHRPSRLRPAVPPWLDDAIAKATAALPADRFSSAGRFAEALAPRVRRGTGSVITVRG